MSRINRAVISLARVRRLMVKPGRENCIAVIVGTVTNDARIFEIPKLTVMTLMYKLIFRAISNNHLLCTYINVYNVE